MTKLEAVRKIVRREGVPFMAPEFSLCPDLDHQYREHYPDGLPPAEQFGFFWRNLSWALVPTADEAFFRKAHGVDFKPGTSIDGWGVAHEPGSEAAKHMTRMYYPLKNASSVADIDAWPMPRLDPAIVEANRKMADKWHAEGLCVMGNMQCTVWETAWYMRGMETLMCDMLDEDPLAERLFDRVTEINLSHALAFLEAGADALFFGDDIGMQFSIMMSEELYRTWIKPRLKRIIDACRAVKPDVMIFYHSCGYVRPFIGDLIEAGIDVLNPVQPECMEFAEIHAEFGDRLSFHGTIGTQTTFPFGTPEEVYETTLRHLRIAGEKGGLLVAPTHLLEPEVPWENIEAYMRACRDFAG